MANFQMPGRNLTPKPDLTMPPPAAQPSSTVQSLLDSVSLGDTLRVPPRPGAKDAGQPGRAGDGSLRDMLSNNAHSISSFSLSSAWSSLKTGLSDMVTGARQLDAGKTLRALSETIGGAAGTVLGAAAYVPSYIGSWSISQGIGFIQSGGKRDTAIGIALIGVGGVAGYAGVALQGISLAATNAGRRIPDLISAAPGFAAQLLDAGKTIFGAASEAIGGWFKGRSAETK